MDALVFRQGFSTGYVLGFFGSVPSLESKAGGLVGQLSTYTWSSQESKVVALYFIGKVPPKKPSSIKLRIFLV